ncbi:MAG TPA: thioesterase family protein [Bryobacteraceae bacterium]|nr:thioesterase family protein [Bryobacteraceae bacterium]
MAESPLSEILSGFPVIVEIPVLWSDEDSFGHVNNIAYLRWLEAGRVEYLRSIQFFPDGPPDGLGPIVASVTCNFRVALTYPDSIIVGTRITRIGNSSFRMDQRIVSRASGIIAVDAETTIVSVDYSTGKPVPVPDSVRAAIARSR